MPVTSGRRIALKEFRVAGCDALFGALGVSRRVPTSFADASAKISSHCGSDAFEFKSVSCRSVVVSPPRSLSSNLCNLRRHREDSRTDSRPSISGRRHHACQRRGASPTKQQPELRVQVRDILSHKDLSDLQRDPDVEAAAPSMPIRLISTASLGMPLPVESRDSAAWGIKAVGASDSARTGKGVKVAILDTGLCRSHPAFKDPDIRVTPRNFVGGDPLDVTDFDGHGTHCAGVIFGRDVDGMRIGVARGITDVLIGKVVGGEGPRWTDWPMRSTGRTWKVLMSCRCRLASTSKRIDRRSSIKACLGRRQPRWRLLTTPRASASSTDSRSMSETGTIPIEVC